MDYVEGKGRKHGSLLSVKIKKAEKGYIIDLSDYAYEAELKKILDSEIILGGTYPAPDGSLLKAWYALDAFLEPGWEGTVQGEVEEIPYEEGVVY